MRRLVLITHRRLKKYWKMHGVLGSARIGLSSAFWRKFLPSHRRSQAIQRDRDKQFDLKLGVGIDTGGTIPISDLLDVESENWMYGIQYEAIKIESISAYLDPLAVDYESTVFVDLGSGKGRAVLLASSIPFKQVVGVEFSQALKRIAENNIRIYKGRVCDTDLILADAADYLVPDEPLVIYLYHPFRRPVMEKVVRNLVCSYLTNPRRVIVLYFGPKCADLWDGVTFLSRVHESEQYYIYDSRPKESGFNLSASTARRQK